MREFFVTEAGMRWTSRGRRRSWGALTFTCVATVLAVVACRDERATGPFAHSTSSAPPGGAVLANNTHPLWAARVRVDSASYPISLASSELSGQAGDTVTLLLLADSAVLAGAGSRVDVSVEVDGAQAGRYPLGVLARGVTVYRFESARSVGLHVFLSRQVERAVPGSFDLVQYTSAKMVSLHTPWVMSARRLAVQSLLTLSGSSCDLTASTGTCGANNWTIRPYFTNPDFCGAGCFQSDAGTGPSHPITISFSQPIDSITLIIEDPTWAGNTMTTYGQNGQPIDSVAFAYSGIAGVNHPDTVTMRGVIDSVIVRPAPNDYVAYLASIFTSQAHIQVSCSGPTVRGQTVSCTATGGTLAVTSWFFSDSEGRHVDRASNQSSLTWSGQLVVQGSVTVTGTVGGTPAAGSAQVTVVPRAWSPSMVTLKDHDTVHTNLLSRPDSFADLGRAVLDLPIDVVNTSQWLAIIADDGPNNNYNFVIALPPTTMTRSQVNTNAINDTSSFYNKQEKRTRKINGVWFCGQPVVTGVLLGLLRKHEGAVSPYPAPDTLPYSHPGVFRHYVDSLAYLRFEPVVGFGGETSVPMVDSVLRVSGKAISDTIADSTHNYITTTTLGGCDHFHYAPYP